MLSFTRREMQKNHVREKLGEKIQIDKICPHLAAQAKGILYWPNLWHACLAFFKTFCATYKGRKK